MTPAARIRRATPSSRISARRIIEAGAAAVGLGLSSNELACLERYLDLVVEWSGRLRLTGAPTREDAARVLVADGLDVLPALPAAGAIADLGSGAGIPGILIALLRPRARVVLVEASRKKAGFLGIAVRELGLANTEVACARAEQLGRDPAHRNRYDAVTARAVADLRVLAEYALPLLRVGGIAVFPKGASVCGEVAAAARAFAVLGGVAAVRAAGSSRSSSVVVVRKTAETPDEYPRRPGIAERRPIR